MKGSTQVDKIGGVDFLQQFMKKILFDRVNHQGWEAVNVPFKLHTACAFSYDVCWSRGVPRRTAHMLNFSLVPKSTSDRNLIAFGKFLSTAPCTYCWHKSEHFGIVIFWFERLETFSLSLRLYLTDDLECADASSTPQTLNRGSFICFGSRVVCCCTTLSTMNILLIISRRHFTLSTESNPHHRARENVST